MIFADGGNPLQVILSLEGITFGEWVSKHHEELFLPYREPNYAMDYIVYILMKRLSQPYSEILKMPIAERDAFFTREIELIEKENEANK